MQRDSRSYDKVTVPSLRGVPESLRLLNQVSILRVLLQGPSTVSELAERIQTSPLTVSKILQTLLTEGLVHSNGFAPGSRSGGKRPRLWEWDGHELFAGGAMVSVGGTRVAVTDYRGTVLATKSGTFSKTTEPKKVEQLIASLLRECAEAAGLEIRDLRGVGIGVPGLTDIFEGVLVFAPHLSGWDNIPLREHLERDLGVPVLLDNEARVQALAERYFGLGKDASPLLCVETGVGISAALIIDGHMFRGKNNTSGEVGHMTLNPSGPKCRCGSRGCWETLASTGRLAALARGDNSVVVDEPYRDPSVSELEEVFRTAQSGDRQAKLAIDDVAHWFGMGLANLINACNPEKIIVHGELTLGGEQLLDKVIQAAHETALSRPAAATSIHFSEMGEDAGIVGAASLIVDASVSQIVHGAGSRLLSNT